MATNLEILSILRKKENYERFRPYIKEHLVGKETWQIIVDLEDFYKLYPEVSWDVFQTWFLMIKHPMFNNEKKEVYESIFSKLDSTPVDDTLKDELVKHFVEKDYAMKIGETALSITEGSSHHTMEDVSGLIGEYEKELDIAADLDTFLVSDDALEILKTTAPGTGLQFPLPELDEALGRIRKGHFVVISAYVGTGKTTMLASQVPGLAKQLHEDEYCLWFNNEENGTDVRQRIMQSVTGYTKEDAHADPVGFDAAWNSSGVKGKIKMIDRAQMFTNDCERYMKKYKPGLIIFDQLWKIHNFTYNSKQDNEAIRLGMMFNWGREIAKQYAPVLAIHQADGTAHGQEWIELNQLYMSRVASQGEIDALVTIGRSLDPGMEMIRSLYTPKNKLTGKENFKAHVQIDPIKVRYVSPS